MPSTSSSSAHVTFLDIAATVERLRRAARHLVERDDNVAAAVLFGSLVTGGATPASDVDLLVVLRGDPRRALDRVPDYSRAFEDAGMGVQVFPWTEAELASRLAERDPFAREILATGVVLAGRLDAALAPGARE